MEHQSPAPSKLHELAGQLNLDCETMAQASSFFSEFEAKKPADAARTDVFVRCAILLASKTTKVESLEGNKVPASYVSVTQLVRSLSGVSLSDFILDLLSFTDTVTVPPAIKHEIQEIKQRYAFSHKFYDKFQDMWSSLSVCDRSDRQEVIQYTRELTWLLFLLARQRLLPDASDVIETTNLLIAVIDQASRLFPASITTNISQLERNKCLEFLCGLVKSKPAVVMEAVARVEALLMQLHKDEFIRSNNRETLAGMFASAHIPYNLQKLNEAYAERMTPAAIDERDFITTSHKVGTPIKQARIFTPFAKHGPSTARQASHRVIKWDEVESQLSLDSNLKDFSARTLSQQAMKSAVATPVTLAMEMNNWLHDQVELVNMEGVLPMSLSDKLRKVERDVEVREVMTALGQAMSAKFKEAGIGTVTTRELSFIEQHFSNLCGSLPLMCQEYLFSNSKVDLIMKLCGVVMERLITSRPDLDISESSIRGLAALCIETAFFLHNITALDFEQVLTLCHCSAVDLWTQLSVFAQVDPRMPVPLKQHFRRIEVKILSSTAWSNDTIFSQLGSGKLDAFLQRVLSQAAQRVLSVSECLTLSDDLKEAIWVNVKYVLSECTEMLRGRHLDQLVLCAIFATCRLHNPKSFNLINEQYAKLNPEEAHQLTHHVALDSGDTNNIISFYNKVFLPKTKDFITGQVIKPAPRVERLCPASPLRSNLPTPAQSYGSFGLPKAQYSGCRSPLTSPFMTPRTKMLYAHRESPQKSTDPGKMHSQRVLSLDEEGAKVTGGVPAHLMHIVNSAGKLPFALPLLKPDEKKI